MSDETRPATPAETRAEMTRLSARGYTQLRHILVQLPDRDKPRASTVSRMLSGRKHRALLLYILLLTAWPWLNGRREPLAADVWIRALTADGAPTWSPSTLSRAWADLEELDLITKSREGRLARTIPRREDGSEDYEVPGGRQDRWNTYFVLPDEFWNEQHFAELSLPALVMLLVVLKETNTAKNHEVWLTYDNVEEWYGIKPKSAQTGLTELYNLHMLDRRRQSINAPLSPTGKTIRTFYSLTGPYAQAARASARAKAAKERQRRLKSSMSPDDQGAADPADGQTATPAP
jgi:DNA-binding transcriptional ArsR family regulator